MLVEDYCQQYAAHAGGGLAFGADGNLYASGGDGSTSAFWDYGQTGTPANPCGDPGGSSPTPPTSEAGRLRAQDLRTTGDPTGLDGSLIRINPATGAAASGNPLAAAPTRTQSASWPTASATRPRSRSGPARATCGWRTAVAVTGRSSTAWRAPSSVRNFGWPCYEGGLDAGGNPYNRIRPKSEEQNLNICQDLYSTRATWSRLRTGATTTSCRSTSGENCEQDSLGSPAGSTLSGATFYPAAGGTFPPMYSKALFFADRLRSCIWALLPGADGLPEARQRRSRSPAWRTRATDLEVTPDGDLLYIDQTGDAVQRIRYTVANQPPTAVATADADHRRRAADGDVQRARLDRPGRRRRAHLRVGPRR